MEQGVHAEFFRNPVLHNFRSEQEKRPIYIDQDWIRIRVVGVANEVIERKATTQDKERFKSEWERYERGLSQATSGTPLESWPRMTPGMVGTLKGLHFFTVEDVANASDIACQKIGMGGYALREDAQKYLNAASQTSAVAELEKIQAENETLRAEVSELKALVQKMVEGQAQQLQNPDAAPGKRRKKEPA